MDNYKAIGHWIFIMNRNVDGSREYVDWYGECQVIDVEACSTRACTCIWVFVCI
jgi:hypothetical protein